ncbi:hypothetical protein Ancab_023526 [Ancistrocladus abbreviatus]
MVFDSFPLSYILHWVLYEYSDSYLERCLLCMEAPSQVAELESDDVDEELDEEKSDDKDEELDEEKSDEDDKDDENDDRGLYEDYDDMYHDEDGGQEWSAGSLSFMESRTKSSKTSMAVD